MAAGLVLVALGINRALVPLLGYRAPLILFVAASLGAAWYGGFGPGVLALVVGFLLGDFFFNPPLYQFGPNSHSDLLLMLVYAGVAAIGLAAIAHLHWTRRREEEITHWNKQLEHRVRERTKELEAFCYSISHDLRAPIRSIASFSQLLKEEYEPHFDARGKEMLCLMIQSATRMDQLVNDLLRLSRLSRKEMEWRTVNLSALVQSIAESQQRAQPERRVRFVIAPNLLARGDEALLRIALENLLNNAWKFTSKQPEGRIEFGLEPQAGKPIYFMRDNGVGFNMSEASKLFGVFERLHSEAAFPGTGIGLAIVQRIVLRHGGQIYAQAVLNQGATFYFTLQDDPNGPA